MKLKDIATKYGTKFSFNIDCKENNLSAPVYLVMKLPSAYCCFVDIVKPENIVALPENDELEIFGYEVVIKKFSDLLDKI